MTRALAMLAALAALAACGASAADRPVVRLEGARAATAGTPWTARLAVVPASAGRPSLLARNGAARRTATVARIGPGRYRARLVFPAPGRWRLEARVAKRTFGLGAVTVRAAAPVAEVTEPFAVALDRDGRVLVADRAANRIVRIDPATAAVTVVAEVAEPLDLAVAADGDLVVVSGERVVRVDAASGAATPVAGTTTRGFSGDGGPATAALLNGAGGVALDAAGNLYIAEYENRIRRVDSATGVISTVAGNGEAGFGGDGGPAARALLHHPHGVAVVGGAVLVPDTENDRIRRIDPDGTIRTVAQLDAPLHVAAGQGGALYAVAADRVHRIAADGSCERRRRRWAYRTTSPSRPTARSTSATSGAGACSGSTGARG